MNSSQQAPLAITIPTEVFDLPVHEIRRGYRSDVYFWRAKRALEASNRHRTATIQVFQKQHAVVCGIEEALAILTVGVGHYQDTSRAFALFDQHIEQKRRIRALYRGDPEQLRQALDERKRIETALDDEWVSEPGCVRVYSLRDGDMADPRETVLLIEGPLSEFVHLETLYLGVLARRTRIATNVAEVARAANGKPVFFFPARFDHWAVQGGDGYAASIGGATAVSTDAQGEWWGMKGGGTIPHCLIAACDGNTVEATRAFADAFPETPLVALVDFQNDCVQTSLEVAEAMGDRLWGVRLDTSETMIDASLIHAPDADRQTGVTPALVRNVRQALDKAGFTSVHIVVSGGFDSKKIARFESEQVPTDAYGVGSAFMKGSCDFTADVVKVDDKPMSKIGRAFRHNERLIERVL